MNERIQELSDIAYKNHLKNTPESSFGRRTDYDKEFAELIIKECMKVAQQQRNPANLNYKPSERFVEDLRQHFGVES
jgi:hypothetical protein